MNKDAKDFFGNQMKSSRDILQQDSSGDALSFMRGNNNSNNNMSASAIVQPKERKLEKTQSTWLTGSTTGANDNGPQISLNDLERIGDYQVPFDQFKGKGSTYREDLYNSTYDYNKLTEAQKNKANQWAREIENEDSKGNRHVAEERGQRQQKDNDYDNEEAMYSGVLGDRLHKQAQGKPTFYRDKKD